MKPIIEPSYRPQFQPANKMKTQQPQSPRSRFRLAVSLLTVVGALLLSFPSARAATLPTGLVGYWTADDTFADVTGNNNGTQQGGVTFTAGRFGKAFLLDGVDDLVNVGTLPGLDGADALTIVAWVRADATLVHPGIVGEWPGRFLLYGGEASAGTTGKGVFIRGAQVVGMSQIPIGQWMHIAAVWRASDGFEALYKNGVINASGNGGGTAPLDPSSANSTSAAIGGLQSGDSGTYVWPGAMDEVAIFRRALSTAEIQDVMTLGVATLFNTPPTLGLTVSDFASGQTVNLAPRASNPAGHRDGAVKTVTTL